MMENNFIIRYLLISTIIICFFACPVYAQDNKFYTSQVIRVISGDTLELKYGEKICLIGIDCPEMDTEEGKQAKEYLLKNVGILYRNVILQFDEEKHDKFGRLLAYVYFDLKQNKNISKEEIERYFYYDEYGNLFLNATLINAGYAQPVIVAPNVKYADLFKELYQEARENKRGLWKDADLN